MASAPASRIWVAEDLETLPDGAIEAFRSSDPAREVFTEGDTLSAEDILPGFAVPVAEIFEGIETEE